MCRRRDGRAGSAGSADLMVDELGMRARFGEPERLQSRLDVLGRYGDINEVRVLVDARRRG